MLTPAQQNALDNLRHYLRIHGNVIMISRRDAVILARLVESLGAAPEPQANDVSDNFCLYCSKAFTPEAPARFEVRHEGKLHAACRSAYERLQAKKNLDEGNVA